MTGTRFPRHGFWPEQEIPRVLRPNREVLRFGGQAVPMAEGQEGFPKRADRGGHHDLTNDRNLCFFRSDGVFGNHSLSLSPKTIRPPAWMREQGLHGHSRRIHWTQFASSGRGTDRASFELIPFSNAAERLLCSLVHSSGNGPGESQCRLWACFSGC